MTVKLPFTFEEFYKLIRGRINKTSQAYYCSTSAAHNAYYEWQPIAMGLFDDFETGRRQLKVYDQDGNFAFADGSEEDLDEQAVKNLQEYFATSFTNYLNNQHRKEKALNEVVLTGKVINQYSYSSQGGDWGGLPDVGLLISVCKEDLEKGSSERNFFFKRLRHYIVSLIAEFAEICKDNDFNKAYFTFKGEQLRLSGDFTINLYDYICDHIYESIPSTDLLMRAKVAKLLGSRESLTSKIYMILVRERTGLLAKVMRQHRHLHGN